MCTVAIVVKQRPPYKQLDLLVRALLAYYGLTGFTLLVHPQAFSALVPFMDASSAAVERLTRMFGCALLAMAYIVLMSCVFPQRPDRRVLCGCLLFHSLCCMVQVRAQLNVPTRGGFGQPALHVLFAAWLTYRLRPPNISIVSLILATALVSMLLIN